MTVKPKVKYRRHKAPRQIFNIEFLKALAADLVKKGGTVHRTVIDDQVQGLRAIVRSSGRITFHVLYELEQHQGSKGNEHPYRIIGEYPEMSITEARHIAFIVIELGLKGVDIRKGPRPERLVQELKEWGTRWTPNVVGARETVLHVALDNKTLDKAQETAKDNPNTLLTLHDTAVDGLRVTLSQREPIRFRVGKLTLGTYPETSVADARKMARPLIEMLAKGVKIEEDVD